MKTILRGPLLRWALLAILWVAGPAALVVSAQTPQESEAQLAEEFTDPLTTLPQFFLRDTYSPATYGTRAQTNQAVLRAIIPRIPAYSLLPFVQLIRPTFSLVTVPSSKGGTRTELGDTQLFDLAVMPWPDRESGVKIGIGPTFVFPTATSKSAGQSSWQAGPAFAVVYTGVPGLLAGFLFQDPISFAYSSPNRAPVNTLDVTARDCSPCLAWMVPEIHGCDLAVWLSSPYLNDFAVKRWYWRRSGYTGFATHQLLYCRAVDGLPTIRTGDTPDERHFWCDGRFSRA